MGKAGKKRISSLKNLVKSNIALTKRRKKKSKKKPPSPNTEKKLKSLLKKDEAVKKSERIIVKQTNSKSKSKLRKTQKITKEVSVPSANDVESTKIVNDTEPVLKTSSLDFPVTPAGIGNISMDNTDTPNESISNIDGVYDQSIDNLNVLPIPQVEAIRTISAQVIEDMSERLKSQLLKDIKHLVASEIKKIEIRPHNVQTYKRHSKDSESYTEKISPTRQNSSTKMEPGVRQLRKPTSSQHLHFENLDQFLDDVRIYISQELIGGNSKSNHASGQRVKIMIATDIYEDTKGIKVVCLIM